MYIQKMLWNLLTMSVTLRIYCREMAKQLNLRLHHRWGPPQTPAASPQEFSWELCPQTPAGAPPDPVGAPPKPRSGGGLGAETPAGFGAETNWGSGGGAPSGVWGGAPTGVWGRTPRFALAAEPLGGLGAPSFALAAKPPGVWGIPSKQVVLPFHGSMVSSPNQV